MLARIPGRFLGIVALAVAGLIPLGGYHDSLGGVCPFVLVPGDSILLEENGVTEFLRDC